MEIDYNKVELINPKTNIEVFAEVLYNEYPIFIYIAGLLLLLAMIGAITLTTSFNYQSHSKLYKNPSKIFKTRFEGRITNWSRHK